MITAEQLQQDLTKYTADHSRYEEARNYIGLSSIWDCPAAIINRYLHGNVDPGARGRLKCYKGYQIEDDVVERLIAIYGSGRDAFERIKRDVSIILFDGLVQGHMELMIDEIPIEVKSVPLDEHLPQKVPKKVLWQVNAYMKYLPSDSCFVIYESRESGLFRVFEVFFDKEFGKKIEEKVRQLVSYAERYDVPDCDCGRCPPPSPPEIKEEKRR